MGRDAHFFPFFCFFIYLFFPTPSPSLLFSLPRCSCWPRECSGRWHLRGYRVIFTGVVARAHAVSLQIHGHGETLILWICICMHIYMCVYGGRVKKKGSKTWPCWSISRNRYMEYQVYIYSFSSYIFTNKIVYLGIWSSFVPRNPLKTNSIAVKLSEITM